MSDRNNHKWNGPIKNTVKATSQKGGLAVSCIKCGCVREYVAGIVTYFINDSVYSKSPNCKTVTEPHKLAEIIKKEK